MIFDQTTELLRLDTDRSHFDSAVVGQFYPSATIDFDGVLAEIFNDCRASSPNIFTPNENELAKC